MNTFGNPWLLWSRFAWTGAEMMTNAAQVVAHRSMRMALAGPVPGARDRREHQIMSQEKFRAAGASAAAVVTRMALLNQQFALLMVKEGLAAATAAMTLGARRLAEPAIESNARLMQDTVTQAAVAASRLSGATAQIAQQALNPVHARTARNVKRLRKRR